MKIQLLKVLGVIAVGVLLPTSVFAQISGDALVVKEAPSATFASVGEEFEITFTIENLAGYDIAYEPEIYLQDLPVGGDGDKVLGSVRFDLSEKILVPGMNRDLSISGTISEEIPEGTYLYSIDLVPQDDTSEVVTMYWSLVAVPETDPSGAADGVDMIIDEEPIFDDEYEYPMPYEIEAERDEDSLAYQLGNIVGTLLFYSVCCCLPLLVIIVVVVLVVKMLRSNKKSVKKESQVSDRVADTPVVENSEKEKSKGPIVKGEA